MIPIESVSYVFSVLQSSCKTAEMAQMENQSCSFPTNEMAPRAAEGSRFLRSSQTKNGPGGCSEADLNHTKFNLRHSGPLAWIAGLISQLIHSCEQGVQHRHYLGVTLGFGLLLGVQVGVDLDLEFLEGTAFNS